MVGPAPTAVPQSVVRRPAARGKDAARCTGDEAFRYLRRPRWCQRGPVTPEPAEGTRSRRCRRRAGAWADRSQNAKPCRFVTLYQMELVGHDFFLFYMETERPSVVYTAGAYDPTIRLA